MNPALRRALRSLLLPIEDEDAAEVAVAEMLRTPAFGQLADDDHAEYLRMQHAEWRERGEPLPLPLGNLVRAAIRAGWPTDAGQEVASSYRTTHAALQESHLLSHPEASALLSYSRTIATLLTDHKMSASQVARTLSSRGDHFTFAWGAVQAVAAAMRLKPRLRHGDPVNPEAGTVAQLLADDRIASDERFLDSDLPTAIETVAQQASDLAFPGDMAALLLDLLGRDGETFGPYLQILHLQCVITDFFDHPLSMAYEFEPRSEANTTWLFDTYNPFWTAMNAFLNNLKAVERLDFAWSRTVQTSKASAHALVQILFRMESMAYVPRRELAGWMRQWLLRFLALEMTEVVPLPAAATEQSVITLLANVGAAQTNTRGVIEQRVVDAVMASRYENGEGWRPRGLGDPVNATNVSKRKLGDCDFLRTGDSNEIHAYEATAGRLSEVYLNGHLITLRHSLRRREDELLAIADADEWDITITFVAHDFALEGGPADRVLDGATYFGFPITVKFVTYNDLGGAPSADAVASFTEHVHVALNERRTPQRVRDTVQALITP